MITHQGLKIFADLAIFWTLVTREHVFPNTFHGAAVVHGAVHDVTVAGVV
jgi:hypothetical protein